MIGTITLHHNANYGANLQAYALVKCLSQLTEDEVCLVDYRNERIRNLYRFAPFNVLDNGIQINFSSCKRFAKMLLRPQGTLIRDRKFQKFRNAHIPMTKIVKNGEQIKALNCSHLFVGSDQIWNDWITGDQKNRVFYGNVKQDNTVLASYAASLGNQEFSAEEDAAVSAYINNFDFLTVREENLAGLVRNRYRGNVEIVSDPVFLLDKTEWEKLCVSSTQEEPYIFVYFLERNPELFKLAEKVSEYLNLPLRVFCDGLVIPWGQENYDKNADPIDFVSGIRNARFVVTNSFHGTVFSMLFHTPFVTIPDTVRGIRMEELLRKYGLSDRLCYSADAFSTDLVEQDINGSSVEAMLASEREYARDYLRKVLQKRK